jgi:hypothetical protein
LAGIFSADWLTSGFGGSGRFSDGKPNVENMVAIVNFESYFAHRACALDVEALDANVLNVSAVKANALLAEGVSVVEVFIGLVGVFEGLEVGFSN